MRCVPVLILLVSMAFANAVAPPRAPSPRLDVNGDPLPGGAVARLGSLRFQPHDPYDHRLPGWLWHSGTAAVALSPDGTQVAAVANGSTGGTWIDFMDTSTGK